MKKSFTRLMAALLTLATVLSLGVMLVSATDTATLTNQYKPEEAFPCNGSYVQKEHQNYYASNFFEVKAGDTVYFGPCMPNQGYYLTSYNTSGAVVKSQIKLADCTTYAKFDNNAIICSYTVPDGVAKLRMATSQLFAENTLITVNRPYDAEEYFAYWDAKNVNTDLLRVKETELSSLVNIFPHSDKTFAGRVDAGEVADFKYRSSDYVKVNAGDVIYFAAADFTQGYHLALYDANKTFTSTVKKDYMVHYEDYGNGFVCFAYRMRSGTAYVRVVTTTGTYNDKAQLATINQPFSKAQYEQKLGIKVAGEAVEPRDNILSGKRALFCGDSISYGHSDNVSPLRVGKAWAGRLQLWTGLIATNASVSGAKVTNYGDDAPEKFIQTQVDAHKDETFDMVVMHGGVNDAGASRRVGAVSADDKRTDFNTVMYVSALESLFEKVTNYFPEADLFFIANFHLDGNTSGKRSDMSEYFDGAEAACKKWGVTFIDLYNNKELNDELESTTKKYLPDLLHPDSAGYDLITPYIQKELEDFYKAQEPAPTEPALTEPEATEPETAPVTEPEGTEAPNTTPADDGGCGSALAGAIAIVAVLGTAISFRRR